MLVESILLEFGKSIIRLLLNPLLYWFVLLTFFASYTRVNKERKQFGRKIYPLFDEWYGQRLKGLIFGLAISAVMIVLGVILHPIFLLGITILTVLFSLNKRFVWLSSAYTFGFTAIVLLFLPYYHELLPSIFSEEITQTDWIIFTTLMGLLLLFESHMVSSVSADQTFPELSTSSRGKLIGQHRLKKITLIPLLMIWPVGSLTSVFSWWPVFEWGGEPFGLIIFPLLIGVEFTVRGGVPTNVAKRFSELPLLLGLIVILLSLFSYYFPFLSLVSILVAIIGREWLAYRLRAKDKDELPYFNPIEKGLKVLATLPGSPAVELGLTVGDTITKVNGQPISNPTEFYYALQSNRTFCKLDVIDDRGEIRFTQRSFYQGEHHELGIIFVESQKVNNDRKII